MGILALLGGAAICGSLSYEIVERDGSNKRPRRTFR